MMNKKMIALLLAVSTISTSMFAIVNEVFQGTGKVVTGTVEAPGRIVTGKTWNERRAEGRERRLRNKEMKQNIKTEEEEMEEDGMMSAYPYYE